jgi:hypothetical protein
VDHPTDRPGRSALNHAVGPWGGTAPTRLKRRSSHTTLRVGRRVLEQLLEVEIAVGEGDMALGVVWPVLGGAVAHQLEVLPSASFT